MKKATATATVNDGKLTIHNRKLFDEQIKSFSNGRCIVVVEKVYNKRSNPQNAYYHAVIVPMVHQGLRELGHDVNREDTHEILKAMFNKVEFVDKVTGEVNEFGGSTTKLSTIEMMEFIGKIQRWASEYLNIFIPDPI